MLSILTGIIGEQDSKVLCVLRAQLDCFHLCWKRSLFCSLFLCKESLGQWSSTCGWRSLWPTSIPQNINSMIYNSSKIIVLKEQLNNFTVGVSTT